MTGNRRYERGDNRTKHLGTSDGPEIMHRNGEIIGRCPRDMAPSRRQALLDDAVGCVTTEPYSVQFPKRLDAVDTDGSIHTAQTSNPGDSYHGYPYAGRMGKRLIEAPRRTAIRKGCGAAFDCWVKRHIRLGGPPDL